MVGADEMVARGLRGGVGRVGSIRSGLGELASGTERAVDLVRGDVQKAKLLLLGLRKVLPVPSSFLKQAEGSHHIGFHECGRAVDRPVDMAFRGKINDRAWPMSRQELRHQIAVPNVALHENVPRVGLHVAKRFEIARIRQSVEVDDGRVLFGDPLPNKLTADESGSTGDQDGLHAVLSLKNPRETSRG